MIPDRVRDRLLDLSHELGREERQLSILGEGNTSADNGDGTFWTKASGTNLETLTPGDLSRVRTAAILELLEGEEPSQEVIEETLLGARVDLGYKKPSVETFLHALCLSEGGSKFGWGTLTRCRSTGSCAAASVPSHSLSMSSLMRWWSVAPVRRSCPTSLPASLWPPRYRPKPLPG